MSSSAEEIVRHYHECTSHRFEAYAAGPDALDWDAQPSPFRHFKNTQEYCLPPFASATDNPDLLAALKRPFSTLNEPFPALTLTLETLGALLHLSLGITAWKSYGPDRWAVRANPSSGNLHPTEAYLLVKGMPELADGIYHYRVEDHVLEHRADFAADDLAPFLYIALSSVMWRETWKYGERAFRYCQLDTGHAVAALSYAASAMGWQVLEQAHIGHQALAHTLGLDRKEDFPSRRSPETELEEAEVLLSLLTDSTTQTPAKLPTVSAWYGVASTVDAHPMYHWPLIAEIAEATRQVATEAMTSPVLPQPEKSTHHLEKSIAEIILNRRSAQRFDPKHTMPKADFLSLLASLSPAAESPWDALAYPPQISLIFFIHRVEGLASGLYLLDRVSVLSESLHRELDARFLFSPISDTPLSLLTPAPSGELHRATRSLHCHQDIASTSCFSIGMLSSFDENIAKNPASYRNLYREAGLIGQVLYLLAEAFGLRGTGIGCYFDHAVHELLGIKHDTFKSMYHFTVGLPLDDPRIETVTTNFLTR